MSVDDQTSNPSGNIPFLEILKKSTARRNVLKGSLAVAVTSFFPTNYVLARNQSDLSKGDSIFKRKKGTLVGFSPVSTAEGKGPWPTISKDYEFQVLISWGEPLQTYGPSFSWPPSSSHQEQQIGIGHDGMTYFPIDNDSKNYGCGKKKGKGKKDSHGVLAINHEFGRNTHVLGKSLPENLEDVRVSQHAHGVSVVEIKNCKGRWMRVESKKNRRIHVNTPVTFSGPVANHELIQTPSGNAPKGTVNNCSNGQTPWGTYLTCEENFNGYFAATGHWTPTEEQARYGFSTTGFSYGWERFDPRFDLSNKQYSKEENRFGWVVEIDPMDPQSTPVKRTALGRFKHEGVAITVGKGGRIVAYMGDDQRFDYIYKFVSTGNWKLMRARGINPLDEGKLYVARFNDDHSGEWLELTIDNSLLAARFNDQAEVLTYARIAADILGATPMDRPEWTTVAPNGDVYCTLTNNSKRTEADAANPMAPNADGHIIKWRDSHRHTGLNFEWDIFLIARDSHGTEYSYSDPDGLWADPDGRLFIQTDGGQQDGLNNQVLVADTLTGEIRRLFTGVTKDEITGIAVTPDRRTMFVNIQHPGNGDPGLTNFPVPFDGKTVPRDSTIVITKKDGGVIGS